MRLKFIASPIVFLAIMGSSFLVNHFRFQILRHGRWDPPGPELSALNTTFELRPDVDMGDMDEMDEGGLQHSKSPILSTTLW